MSKSQITPVEEESKISEDKKSTSQIFSPKIIEDLAQLIPSVTFDEIMHCSNYDQRAADRSIYQIGVSFGNFRDPEELNLAMQIISVIIPISLSETGLTKENIYQEYCKNYMKIEYDTFLEILSKLIGRSTYSALQNTYQGIILTDFGTFLFEYYKKLKAEMMAIQKYGKMRGIFSFLMGFRTMMNYDYFNMDVNPFYAQIRALKQAIKEMREEGESLFSDNAFSLKIESIHNLIDELLTSQEIYMQDHSYSIQDHSLLLTELFRSISDILNIYSKKIDFSFDGVLINRLNNPAPLIERYILENWNQINWKNLFYGTNDTAGPTRIVIPFGKKIIERAIVQNLITKPMEELSDLPKDQPAIISKITIEDLKIRKEEVQKIKNQIWTQIQENIYDLDYEVIQDKDILSFFRKMIGFYTLAFERKIHVEDKIQKISDLKRNVKSFTARKFKLLKKIKSD
jgi:hypothetical protein